MDCSYNKNMALDNLLSSPTSNNSKPINLNEVDMLSYKSYENYEEIKIEENILIRVNDIISKMQIRTSMHYIIEKILKM